MSTNIVQNRVGRSKWLFNPIHGLVQNNNNNNEN